MRHINLVLRGLMELGIIAAMAYWGHRFGDSAGTKLLWGIGLPLLVFGFWGLVDFRNTGYMAEPLRLIQELVISGGAAVALYVSGQHVLGWSLGMISIIHHALVYALGDTLLKR